jgi:beta-glucosidase
MDFASAREALRNGKDPVEAARALVAAMTPEERLWCLDGDLPTHAGLAYLQNEDGYHRDTFPAAEVARLGVPGLAFSDGPRGCVVGNATAFPVTMARGATWDPDLEERVGDAMGRELRAAGATLTGAVCVNLLRHPAWGRAQETYGEDPHHVGEMGAALTRGLQKHLMACVKHLACNSMENARFSVDVEVDQVALHEVFLPHFRRIVDEGVASVMSAYNSVNGEWCGQSKGLLRDVLRDEWGFQGFVISDWIFGLRDAAPSLAAGLDVEMPYRMVRMRDLPAALEKGDVSWDDVDAAVVRIVSTLLRFDSVLATPSPPRTILGAAEHRALAREVAAASAVLLRNDPVEGSPILPLTEGSSLAVIGELAVSVNLGDAGSSDVWDDACTTVLAGLQREDRPVSYDDGTDLEQAARVAAAADVAVVVVGYTRLDEGEYVGAVDPALYALFPSQDEPEVAARFEERLAGLPETTKPPRLADRGSGFGGGGDRVTLRLKDHDVALIKAVAAANPRIVVALQAGSAVLVDEWVEQVPAVLQSWYAGCEAGTGLADVLTGRAAPSGRLPFSVPAAEADLPFFDSQATSIRYDRWHGWWHLQRQGTPPAFPFGFGLGYTTFELSESSVRREGVDIVVTFDLRNTGSRGGSDVVQVYAQLPDPDAPCRLVAFQRVRLDAGATTSATMTVPLERLQTRDPTARQWLPPTGPHVFVVARHAGDPHADTHQLVLEKESRP